MITKKTKTKTKKKYKKIGRGEATKHKITKTGCPFPLFFFLLFFLFFFFFFTQWPSCIPFYTILLRCIPKVNLALGKYSIPDYVLHTFLKASKKQKDHKAKTTTAFIQNALHTTAQLTPYYGRHCPNIAVLLRRFSSRKIALIPVYVFLCTTITSTGRKSASPRCNSVYSRKRVIRVACWGDGSSLFGFLECIPSLR